MLLSRSVQLVHRLRHLSPLDGFSLIWLTLLTALRTRRGSPPTAPVSPAELQRWFGSDAPVLYHPNFGHTATGPAFSPTPAAGGLEHVHAADPRIRWEAQRDQDLAATVATALVEADHTGLRSTLVDRLHRAVAAPPPNSMEGALRSVAWLELARFLAPNLGPASPEMGILVEWLVRTGTAIERGLHEVPLGGNHYLSHAVGLLYIGRLLPGRPESARWARRGQAIAEHEALRQFHSDGGGYEGSTAYHLFSLELLLGATLLLRGQGVELPRPVRERIRAAGRFLAAIIRPDGSIPLLGDDDSGHLHRWSTDPPARDACALAALLLDDAELAVAAGGCSTMAAWLCGADAPARLAALAASAANQHLPMQNRSFPRTGLHVLRSEDVHAVLWSRDPSPPAMVAHGHSDHNSVDVWCAGTHVLRDPGTGLYVGDPILRNRLRATAAHSTLTLDDVEINPFRPEDIFFMPPRTHGRRLMWSTDGPMDRVATTHDGFRRLPGRPLHRRTVTLDRAAQSITIHDEVVGTGTGGGAHHLTAWWHWGEPCAELEQNSDAAAAHWRFRVGAAAVRLTVPATATVLHGDRFPWAPRYGVIREGRRSIVRHTAGLPFASSLLICPA